MHRHIVTIVALVVVPASGCRNAQGPPPEEMAKGFFITTIGEHDIVRRWVTFSVFEADHGRLNYRFTRRTTGGSRSWGPAEAHIEAGDPWFAYVETSRRVWVCDGRERLDLQTWGDEGSGTYSVTHPCSPQQTTWLAKQIPEPVLEQLPEAIIATFSHPESAACEHETVE